MSTSPSSAASAAIASRSRTSRTRPSTRAPVGAARGGRGGADAFGVAAGEQDAVVRRQAGGEPVDERAAEALVGAGDEGDARVHALHASGVTAMREARFEHRYHAIPHGSDFSPTGLRVLARSRRPGSFSAAARALGYTQSAVSRQVAALEAVAGRGAVRPPARRRRR